MKFRDSHNKQNGSAEKASKVRSLKDRKGSMLTDEELTMVAGGQDVQTMFAYECKDCKVTYGSIRPNTVCALCGGPNIIDLAAQQAEYKNNQ